MGVFERAAEDVGKIHLREGKLATVAGVSVRVHLDYPEDVQQFDGVSSPGQVVATPRMTYETAALPNLKHGDAVAIEGVNYKVRYTRKLDEGAVSVAELAKG